MKLLTLNTHSLAEPEYEKKLNIFAQVVLREQPDVMAFQEVNQTRGESVIGKKSLEKQGYVPCRLSQEGMEPARVTRDHHGLRLARLLRAEGLAYNWTWVPAKIGYGRFDEGLALFSRWKILDTDQCYISQTRDYTNWKTRRLLGIQAQTPWGPRWFGCVHMGWWQDQEEPFSAQWVRLSDRIRRFWHNAGQAPIWLMGDFNSPSHVRGQGFDCVQKSGWKDTYQLAREKDQGFTARGKIDGWRTGDETQSMRIDYIWCSRDLIPRSSRVICNGLQEPVVSDHYGILLEYI